MRIAAIVTVVNQKGVITARVRVAQAVNPLVSHQAVRLGAPHRVVVQAVDRQAVVHRVAAALVVHQAVRPEVPHQVVAQAVGHLVVVTPAVPHRVAVQAVGHQAVRPEVPHQVVVHQTLAAAPQVDRQIVEGDLRARRRIVGAALREDRQTRVVVSVVHQVDPQTVEGDHQAHHHPVVKATPLGEDPRTQAAVEAVPLREDHQIQAAA